MFSFHDDFKYKMFNNIFCKKNNLQNWKKIKNHSKMDSTSPSILCDE